jgi:hypothetical protein
MTVKNDTEEIIKKQFMCYTSTAPERTVVCGQSTSYTEVKLTACVSVCCNKKTKSFIQYAGFQIKTQDLLNMQRENIIFISEVLFTK